MLFRRREHRRNDHRSGVHGAALKGVVVIFAMRGSAVTQRRRGDVEAAGMANRFCGRLQRRAHIGGMARGDAQAGDIHQHSVAHAGYGDWERWLHGAECCGELLRDGDFGEGQAASDKRRYSASILLARATAVQ